MASGTVTRRLRIGGMTCVNCQNKIEQKLRNTAGITAASVSYSTGLADVTYDPDLISRKDIVGVIERLDYTVLPDQEPEAPDITRMVCFLAIIVSLYVLLERFGVLNRLVPSQLADTAMGYGMLFVVGLVTSVHCIAMCGGINLSQCIPRAGEEAGGGLSALRPALLYNLGRVASYTAIGFLLGLLGLLLGGGTGAGLSAMLQGILKLIAGGFMVVVGINMLGLFPWLRRLTPRLPRGLAVKIGAGKARSRRPFAVGLLNGLMPCGPLQSMQIVALASGSPIAGALSMLLFSLGTVPLMLGLGSLVAALGKRFARAVTSVGAVLVVVLGLAMLSQGGSLSGLLLPEQLFVLVIVLCVLAVAASLPVRRPALRSISAAAAICVAAAVFFGRGSISAALSGAEEEASGDSAVTISDGVQVVNSTLTPGRYPNITVQAGIPVRWVIDAPEGSINGCNYKMLLQEYGIEYAFQTGENVIEFVPVEAGTFRYSCWMGMIHGNIFVTDGDAPASEEGSADVPVPAGYQIPAGELAVAERGEDESGAVYQTVTIQLTEDGFQPAVMVVEAGTPVFWMIQNSLDTAGGASLLAPYYSTVLDLSQGDNPISFYPLESFAVSTGDSAFYAYVKVVDDLGQIDTEAIRAEAEGFETLIYPADVFAASGAGASCCG